MKLKKFTLALGLAVLGFSAHAVDITSTVALLGDPHAAQSAGLSAGGGAPITHQVSGTFSDTFNFNVAGSGLVDVYFYTSAALNDLANQQIVFSSANLNGVALDIDADETDSGTIYRGAALFQTPTHGNLVLTINGYAGLLGSTQPGISASYAGTLNVTAVPEPSSYALLAAGLLVLGFVVRRKRSVV
ncbi:FxDxF family PEP-CTERM protein [Roseateles sp. GG27B]